MGFLEFSEAGVGARAEKTREEREREREVLEVTAAKTDLVRVGVLLVAIDGETKEEEEGVFC